MLYSAVGELAQLDQDSIVLDVCCGTGTIGISLAKVMFFFFFCQCIGVVCIFSLVMKQDKCTLTRFHVAFFCHPLLYLEGEKGDRD